MSIDKPLIKTKLQQLDEYIKRIEEMQFSESEFLDSNDLQDLLTFRLLQAVEIALDTVTHIIAELDLEKPLTARSSFEVLQKQGILSEELSNTLAYAVSFRNLAVHAYEGFDFKRLFSEYKNDIKDLKKFADEIIRFLETRVD